MKRLAHMRLLFNQSLSHCHSPILHIQYLVIKSIISFYLVKKKSISFYHITILLSTNGKLIFSLKSTKKNKKTNTQSLSTEKLCSFEFFISPGDA